MLREYFCVAGVVVPMEEKARRVQSKKRKRAEEVEAVVEKDRRVKHKKKRKRADEGERHTPPRKQRERSK